VSPLEPVEGGIRLRLHIQPRAATSSLAGLHGDRLRVRLAAPPVDGAANEELVRFLARLLDVPLRAVEITAGHGSRQKTVVVDGVEPGVAARALELPLP